MCKLLRKLGSKFANYEGSQEESVQIRKVKVFVFTFLHMLNNSDPAGNYRPGRYTKKSLQFISYM